MPAPALVLPLATARDAHELVGGKGRSLARLANGGFDVPGGFHVTTAGYDEFVAHHGLQQRIDALARPALRNGNVSFEQASADIQALFAERETPSDLAAAIRAGYDALPDAPAVAVRSSATAEDLPDLSFAGQQETVLNVTGASAVVAAVKRCWASLWTPQALGYRHRNGIEHGAVGMAVVVQRMVPAEVSGILFTANPTTGERGEMVVNASFGLGEAVVGGQVTPDTVIVDRDTLAAKETMVGAKERQIVADSEQGTRFADVDEAARKRASLTGGMLRELAATALRVEALQGAPQDIEWAWAGGRLHLLQARPITNLPPQPIAVEWVPKPPARYLARRQIVENMPDPICPLFEELYLTDGLGSMETPLTVGGGGVYVTVNGYAYQRRDKERASGAGELRRRRRLAVEKLGRMATQREQARHDTALFADSLAAADRAAFDAWAEEQDAATAAFQVTMPESGYPPYAAYNHTAENDRLLQEWQETTRPRLVAAREKWQCVDAAGASDETLLAGIRELAMEEGHHWASNGRFTLSAAKFTDEQLQCFLRETLPDHQFISGHFLSGFESKTMQANADLFAIAKLVRQNAELAFLVAATPPKFVLRALRARADSGEVLQAMASYLATYGHQGYNLDFVEPTQAEDPAALFVTLKRMVQDAGYDPKDQLRRTAAVREAKTAEISRLLEGLPYWQFRFRLWLARRYNPIREEVAFHFGYTWGVLRQLAHELGQRLAAAGTCKLPEDVYFLVTAELRDAIAARANGEALPELGDLAAERRALREARKRLHPPGTIPEAASGNAGSAESATSGPLGPTVNGVAIKATQIKNNDASDTMRGFAVSSGRVTAPASVILGPAEFDNMLPGSILVSPLTTPAWTPLFAHAAGLVTDMGSILAHGSIVARECGIPAVLGVGNGTVRIKHGQTLTIDGDAGTVLIHPEGPPRASS